MKALKWICRYAFLVLLLAASVLWCYKCHETAGKYDEVSNRVEFIDTVLDDFDSAVAIRDRAEFFDGLFVRGVIAASVMSGLLVLLILWNAFGGKISSRSEKKVKVREASAMYSPATEAVSQTEVQNMQKQIGGFCTGCGMHFDEMPEFCTNCGKRLK